MSPLDFKTARNSEISHSYVANKPYFPKLSADANDNTSIFKAASTILYYPNSPPPLDDLSLTKVTGGVTNAIFCVSGYSPPHPKSVLVRIFGAEGMIDRDMETSVYSSLSDEGIAVQYYGRFANGRVEGWLEGYRPLDFKELGDRINTIASELAKLHATYQSNEKEITLWNQLFDWYEQASKCISDHSFSNPEDRVKAQGLFETFDISNASNHIQNEIIPRCTNSKTCFCHNDYQPLNIMMNDNGDIQMIDFEYGGYNYLAFDIANHFNEYAGGNDNAKPDYSLYPSLTTQEEFIKSYLKAYTHLSGEEFELEELKRDVKVFASVNNLYWGLWAVNQAACEGCDGFDYLLYAKNRFRRYVDTR